MAVVCRFHHPRSLTSRNDREFQLRLHQTHCAGANRAKHTGWQILLNSSPAGSINMIVRISLGCALAVSNDSCTWRDRKQSAKEKESQTAHFYRTERDGYDKDLSLAVVWNALIFPSKEDSKLSGYCKPWKRDSGHHGARAGDSQSWTNLNTPRVGLWAAWACYYYRLFWYSSWRTDYSKYVGIRRLWVDENR